MHPDTKEIAPHMREFGLHVLGRAIHDATFSEMGARYAHALSVVQAAHGAEIVLKARIAEEHPLLVFERLPKQQTTAGLLIAAELFLHGRSYDYFELPQRLWATTGHRLPNPDQYEAFGRRRNQIIHFAVPNVDLAAETIRFCMQVIEPALCDFGWDESCMEHADEWDEVTVSEGYFSEQVQRLNLTLDPRVQARLDKLTRYPQA